ncbi:flagellar hook capping FlgD N-terminal domain-containing protein [Celeribacter arenosi]|uniref:Basal-body rod modification protein FlgD n=1 Tax=Celeribacter arenosi TaxID=792649 RepID=A0ABP7JY58_9RHOB
MVDAITSATPASSGFSNTAQQKTGTSGVSSDFETFLKMLTVQMQNQDPLNPIESSDYAVQLATFSSVEQQVLTNDLLTSLGNQFNLMGLSQISSWVGQEARSTAPVLFDGSPLDIVPAPATGADKMVIAVKDSKGDVVQRMELAPSDEKISWAGVSDSGNPMPTDTYSFTVESYAHGQLMSSKAAESFGKVIEARAENGGIVLTLEGGSEVAAEAVTSIREAAS